MSVRRLAEKQPPSFVFTPENLEWAKARIANLLDIKINCVEQFKKKTGLH